MKYLPILLLITACGVKPPQVSYVERTVTKVDTLTINSIEKVPCDDFETQIFEQKDTVYIKVVDKKIQVKYVNKTDTVYKEPIIIQPQPKKVKIKNKGGSAIGDGNTITTKKNNWWWIFVAGALTMFIIQNVVWKTLKRYIAFL